MVSDPNPSAGSRPGKFEDKKYFPKLVLLKVEKPA